jgi:hypothetical protein
VKASTYRRTNSQQRLRQLKHSGLCSQRRLSAIDLARRVGLFDPGRRSGLLVGGSGRPPSLELRSRLVSRLANLVQDRAIAPRRSVVSL